MENGRRGLVAGEEGDQQTEELLVMKQRAVLVVRARVGAIAVVMVPAMRKHFWPKDLLGTFDMSLPDVFPPFESLS
jgi:hypothetical protein